MATQTTAHRTKGFVTVRDSSGRISKMEVVEEAIPNNYPLEAEMHTYFVDGEQLHRLDPHTYRKLDPTSGSVIETYVVVKVPGEISI